MSLSFKLLSEDKQNMIRDLVKLHYNPKLIAEVFGISKASVAVIKANMTREWKKLSNILEDDDYIF